MGPNKNAGFIILLTSILILFFFGEIRNLTTFTRLMDCNNGFSISFFFLLVFFFFFFFFFLKKKKKKKKKKSKKQKTKKQAKTIQIQPSAHTFPQLLNDA